jgi:hypothetical protein
MRVARRIYVHIQQLINTTHKKHTQKKHKNHSHSLCPSSNTSASQLLIRTFPFGRVLPTYASHSRASPIGASTAAPWPSHRVGWTSRARCESSRRELTCREKSVKSFSASPGCGWGEVLVVEEGREV